MVRGVDGEFRDGCEGVCMNFRHDVAGRRPVDQRLVGDLLFEADIQPIGFVMARCAQS